MVLKNLVSDQGAGGEATAAEPGRCYRVRRRGPRGPAGGGHGHTPAGSVAWQQHKPGPPHVVNYPPMQLSRDERDDSGRYLIATLDIPRDEVVSTR